MNHEKTEEELNCGEEEFYSVVNRLNYKWKCPLSKKNTVKKNIKLDTGILILIIFVIGPPKIGQNNFAIVLHIIYGLKT